MIRNATKGTTIAKEHELVKSIAGKAKGLMFCNKVKKPLLFEFENEQNINLHMLFVFCPIDVILIGNDNKVVELKENLKPFMLFNSRRKARYVIELEKGQVKRSRTEEGDILQFLQ